MNRDYPSHPLPAILAALVRDGRLALVQRDKESPAQAAERELFEETGIRAQAGKIIDTFDMVVRDAHGMVRNHFLILVVECRWLDGDGASGSDACAFGWFDRAAIAGLDHVHDALPRLADHLLGKLS